jgi:transketolase
MADLMAVLFFAEMRFDPKDPRNPESDRFVLSKGHAAPILYSAWAEAGAFDRSELMKLRRIDSDLEGHPTPRCRSWTLPPGLLGRVCAAIGARLNARASDRLPHLCSSATANQPRSVWEAADVGAMDGPQASAASRCQRAGPERPWRCGSTTWRRCRWRAFGGTIVIDGHDPRRDPQVRRGAPERKAS